MELGKGHAFSYGQKRIHTQKEHFCIAPVFRVYIIKYLNIKPKKGISKAVSYLSVDSIALLLKQPESDTKNGIRDLALLSLLYESGCRVQELIDIKFGNLSLTVPATISVTGKGEKYELSH